MANSVWTLSDSNTITVAGASTSFDLQSMQAMRTTHIAKTSSLAAPFVLEQNHDIKPVGNTGNDRHYVTLRRTYLDPVTGKTYTDSFEVKASLARCPVSIRPEANINAMASMISQVVLSSGFIANWVDGIAA